MKFGVATEAAIDYPYRAFLKAMDPTFTQPCLKGRLIGENVYEWCVNLIMKTATLLSRELMFVFGRRFARTYVRVVRLFVRPCVRPFMRASSILRATEFRFPVYRYKKILESHRSFRSSDSIFSFIWTTDWAHSEVNHLKRADGPTHDLIAEMRTKGDLNNSVLVFLSDHGLRHSGFVETELGKYEGKLWRICCWFYHIITINEKILSRSAHSVAFHQIIKNIICISHYIILN